jgi:hypothetical protein
LAERHPFGLAAASRLSAALRGVGLLLEAAFRWNVVWVEDCALPERHPFGLVAASRLSAALRGIGLLLRPD